MADAPVIRTDRAYWMDSEFDIIYELVWQLAETINSLTLAGPIYGRVLLPPDQAAKKYELMTRDPGPEGGQ